MKALMLHNDYAETGGEYFSVRAEMEALADAGVDALLVSVDNRDVMATAGSKGLLWETLTSRSAGRAVHDAIDKFRPDIVHAQNIFPLMGRGAISAIQDSGLPWVRTLRNYRLRCIAGTCFRDDKPCTDCVSASRGAPGVRHACYRSSTAASSAAIAYAILERSASRQYPPSAYILLSTAMQNLLGANLGSTPTYIKPNSVPGDLQTEVAPRSIRESEFIFVGRFSAEKGIPKLVSDFSMRPDLKLNLIGGGELDEKSLSTIHTSANISLTGELSPAGVRERMQKSIAVLVPSQWDEPFGRVAAEALAVGTPALVSDRGGLPDIVQSISEFRLVVGDSENWAERAAAINSLDDAQYDDLAAACFRRWQSTFEPDTVGRQLVEIYGDVLDGHQIDRVRK